jgi:transposase
VGTILAKLDFLDEAITALSAAIEEAIRPFAAEVELLRTIPGVEWRTAQGLVAEIGVDMTRFGAAGRLAAWAGMCPGNNTSAGKHGRGTTRKGSKWLRTYLRQSAKAAARTKATYLAAHYARLRGRRGSAKATVAVGHSILVAAYYILTRREPYHDLGPDYFTRRRDSREHHAGRLVRQLQALGYCVSLQPQEAAA